MQKEKLQLQKILTPQGNEISMVRVTGGRFMMGSEKGDDDEQPVQHVEVSPFWISQFQLSQELWEEIMGENPARFPGQELPVEQVSWEDIQEFLQKLNQIPELKGENPYRLPTEAEWEYAARGGRSSLSTGYSGSQKVHKVASYNYRDAHIETQLLGLKAPNKLGLYDMSGNVWEWCQDWYGGYKEDTLIDPQGPETGQRRVLRGGSWGSLESLCRVSFRYSLRPGYRSYFIGFRLARTAIGE